jgi:hypothetical protein
LAINWGSSEDRFCQVDGGRAACVPRPNLIENSGANMRKSIVKYVIPALAGLLAVSSFANAQQAKPFDAKTFFEELATRGVKSPAAFDAQKFFEELATRGKSDSKKLDPKTFFEELNKRGFSSPTGFDAKKFFEEQMTRGNMPPMVDMKS